MKRKNEKMKSDSNDKSSTIEYWVMVLDMVQGYPIKRDTERMALTNIKLGELHPLIKKLESQDDNRLTKQERWDRDIEIVSTFLFPDGSMYCKGKYGEYYLTKSSIAITRELIDLGLYWASKSHVYEAQKLLEAQARIPTE